MRARKKRLISLILSAGSLGAQMSGLLEFSLHGGVKNTGEAYRYPEATSSLAIPFKHSLGDFRLSGVARPSQKSLAINVGYFY